jgi:hypothetical protein
LSSKARQIRDTAVWLIPAFRGGHQMQPAARPGAGGQPHRHVRRPARSGGQARRDAVARARAVVDELVGADAATVLLTGRIRPADRDYLLCRGWYERVRAGRQRGPGRIVEVLGR